MSETSFLHRMWDGLRQRWRRARARRQIAHGFDSIWLRWSLAVALVANVVLLVLAGSQPWALDAFPWAALSIGVLVTVYFVHLLFARMQCSLAEWIVLVLALGNVEGLLMSTPYVRQLGWVAVVTAMLLAALVLYGFVMGLSEARLLGVRKTAPRLMLIVANWLSLPSPILLLGGIALWIGRGAFSQGVSPAMATWAGPLFAMGLVGVGVGISVSVVARRRARVALGDVLAGHRPALQPASTQP
jgi:hypothetical protein